MSNNPADETETFSTTERWVIFIVIYVVSLIICMIYLFLRIDIKQFSFPIFVLCLIYSSLFVMLNVISMFDLMFSHEKGMVKFFDMVSTFYEIFNWVDKILGYVIFNLLIAMMESGYSKMWKKFFDYWIRICKSIPNNLCIIIFRLIIALGILAILIIFRERFNLGNNPFDYFSIILDVFGMQEIYTNVGFFFVHLISDYRRKKDQIKLYRYDRYSKIKIIETAEKYMNKVKDSYNELKKDANIFENNDHPDYHKYLQKIYKEMKEKIREYGYEEKDEENNNNNCNNNTNDNNIINNNTNYNNINPKEPEINSNNIITVYVANNTDDNNINPKEPENNSNNIIISNVEDNTNDRVKNEDFDTSKTIRKFKKAVRKINKLKKLIHEINQETKEDLNRLNMNKKCTCRFVILFIAFSIALITDFLLPIFFDPEDDFTKLDGEKFEKYDTIGELILGLILIYPFSVILSSYTVIMLYATKRKDYISGDYLYDKQINDNINLLKTVQIFCGYSFSILYCNIYFWRTIDTHGNYGKPLFYDTTFIPDYTFKQGITVFMIVKIIIIVSSMIGSYCFCSCKLCDIFQNDLGELDRSGDNSKYDNQNELDRIYQEKGQVVDVLYKQ